MLKSPFFVMYLTQGSALYPLRSSILRYFTWNPETVKRGISKRTLMGVRRNRLRLGEATEGSLISARMLSSFLPGKLGIRQLRHLLSGV